MRAIKLSLFLPTGDFAEARAAAQWADARGFDAVSSELLPARITSREKRVIGSCALPPRRDREPRTSKAA